MKCRTPLTNATSEDCAGEALELRLGPTLYTQNSVPLRRIATPSILGIDPPRGYFAESQWVRVEGYGFLNSDQIACTFVAGEKVCGRDPPPPGPCASMCRSWGRSAETPQANDQGPLPSSARA